LFPAEHRQRALRIIYILGMKRDESGRRLKNTA
jgi:hypothetical protein